MRQHAGRVAQLQRMADRVTVLEDHSGAGFLRVVRQRGKLGADPRLDDDREQRVVQRASSMRVQHSLGHREVLAAKHERVLDEFAHAGAQFVCRQRVQVAGIDDVQAGRVKRPEIVLPITDD